MGKRPQAGPAAAPRGGGGSAAARLTVIHVTDVYTLENFPSLRTLLRRKREENPNTVSLLTGDFLAPYLLSSIDQGVAMMSMLTKTPIDYLTWGNHEADLPHAEVCKRVREFHSSGGVWINSNMQSHEMMDFQRPYEVITVRSQDGSHERKVGLIAVLSDDPSLYKKFKSPGAFNGAKIECPWGTLRKYKRVLEEMGCDLVLPLQHLYEPEDHRTCAEFDFPVILSGHDHHKVDAEVEGTRLLKPGSDAHYAVVLDISWGGPWSAAPELAWEFLRVQDFAPDAELQRAMEEAYAPLQRLRGTELAPVPEKFRPLSSVSSRGRVTTMGRFICSLVRNALNSDPQHRDCDACLIRGGHICGEKDYPPDSFFSLEDLKTVNTDKVSVGVVEMPGELIVRGVKSTRGSISRLFVQYDNYVGEDAALGEITHIAGEPVDLERVYLVATTPTTIRDVPAFAEHFGGCGLPHDDAFVSLDVALLSHCARVVWSRIVAQCMGEGGVDTSVLDTDGDGFISKEEIQEAIQHLGFSVGEGEYALTDFILRAFDASEDGVVDLGKVQESATELRDRKKRFSFTRSTDCRARQSFYTAAC